MKWVALLFFILVGIGFTMAIPRDRRAATAAAFLLGFLPFVMAPWHLYVAPYSFAGWPGHVKGWEIGVIDAIAVACLISFPKARSRLPFSLTFSFYIATAFLSVFLAANFLIALAYPLQLIRVFLVFAAVARIATSQAGLKALFHGLFVGIAYQASMAIWAKMGGALQTGGSLGHQNLLGFISHLVFLPAFGLFLSGAWRKWAWLGLASAAVVVILTVSRATIAFAAIALVCTYLLALAADPSPRKMRLGLVSAVLIGLSLPIILSSFSQRFAAQGNEAGFIAPDGEREAFERAANMLIDDHPMGVGTNHYVVTINTQGYASRAGIGWGTGSRATAVHNSFLLIQAETGYLGLFGILAFLVTAITSSLYHAFKARRSPQSDMLIGMVGALIALTLHSFYEWMLVVHQTQYLFAVSLGLAAGLIRQIKVQTETSSRVRTAKLKSLLAADDPVLRPSP